LEEQSNEVAKKYLQENPNANPLVINEAAKR
jgi:hypothetical protein